LLGLAVLSLFEVNREAAKSAKLSVNLHLPW
jgi:hypothetical protein